MKAAIKTAYIAHLQQTYPTIYLAGSRPLQLAEQAADSALAGRLKLEGDCWSLAVGEVTGWTRWTGSMLAGLPD